MATPVTPVPLPSWTDAASIASYLTSFLAGVVGVVALLHPGFVLPTAVQAVVPAVSALIAGGVQVVNLIWHRKTQIAALEVRG